MNNFDHEGNLADQRNKSFQIEAWEFPLLKSQIQ